VRVSTPSAHWPSVPQPRQPLVPPASVPQGSQAVNTPARWAVGGSTNALECHTTFGPALALLCECEGPLNRLLRSESLSSGAGPLPFVRPSLLLGVARRCCECCPVFSESLQPGPGPLPLLGLLSAGSRPAAAARQQPGPSILLPGPSRPEYEISRFPSHSQPGPGPLLPRGLIPSESLPASAARFRSAPSVLWPSPARPEHEATRFPSHPIRVPARCRYAASIRPGRGPLPGQRPSTSRAESAYILVRPQPAPSPRGLRHWHRVGLGAEALGGGKRTVY
jgi:hypothetical protein